MRYLLLLSCLLAAGPTMIFALSEARLYRVAADAPVNLMVSTDADAVERGRRLARTRGCFGCHGQQLEGQDFGEQWDWPERAVAPNLASYARAHDDATIERAVRQGIGADGRALMSMPSYNFVHLRDEDIGDLIAFLRSAPVVDKSLPTPRLGWSVRWGLMRGTETHMEAVADEVPALTLDAAEDPLRARGEYLAMTMCNECHGLDVRGDTRWGRTPDLAVVAAYTREGFERLITTGTTVDGRRLGLMALVAPDRFPSLRPDEIDALYAFLKDLGATPPPQEVPWRPGS